MMEGSQWKERGRRRRRRKKRKIMNTPNKSKNNGGKRKNINQNKHQNTQAVNWRLLDHLRVRWVAPVVEILEVVDKAFVLKVAPLRKN